MEKLDKICKYIVLCMSGAAVAVLLIISMFRTAIISTDELEYSFVVDDNPVKHILVILLTIVILALIMKKCKEEPDNRSSSIFYIVLFLICMIAGLFFVCIAKVDQTADQASLWESAILWNNGYSSIFESGGYISNYPYQLCAMLFMAFFQRLFGTGYLGFQILNVFAWSGWIICMEWLAEKVVNEDEKYWVKGAALLFLPLFFYNVFVYMTIISLFLVTYGLVMLVKYLDTNKLIYLVVACSTMAIASLLKMNAFIFMIAFVLILLFKGITKKRGLLILGIFLTFGIYVAGNSAAVLLVKSVTGIDLSEGVSQGVPSEASLAMGLQVGSRAPGWENGYSISIYASNDYNTQSAAEAAREDLQLSINNFINSPRSALSFFYGKDLTQWLNPTFQCFWISQTRDRYAAAPEWMKSFMESPVVLEYLNILQTLILFGTLMWILLKGRDADWPALMMLIALIGAVIFYTFWEAKSQYTLPHFAVLMLYAPAGLVETAYWLKEKILNRLNVQGTNKIDVTA